MIEIDRLDHVLISIPLHTREEVRRFYTQKLGWKEIAGSHPYEALWIQVGGIELHIREEEMHQFTSARHAAFAVKNLEETKSFLRKNAIEISYSSKIDGRDRCFFRDPWGNRFELIEYEN